MNKDKLIKTQKLANDLIAMIGKQLILFGESEYPIITGTALSGAIRRKSLDLTRALAAMRRP